MPSVSRGPDDAPGGLNYLPDAWVEVRVSVAVSGCEVEPSFHLLVHRIHLRQPERRGPLVSTSVLM